MNPHNSEKKYQVIYADPPWSYENSSVPQAGVDHQYSTMALEDIKALPIGKLADKDCALLMWATFPLLKEALEVIEAWGFKYKTLGFSWIKTNADGTPFFGVGYYAKSNCEVCLLATKGNAHSLVKSNSVSSVIMSPKARHSAKPPIVRDKIVELFGDIPRVELFARADQKQDLWGKNTFDGWDTWGNQIEGTLHETLLSDKGVEV